MPHHDVQRQNALRVLALGYKALARELHPDVGGSHEAMALLNALRDCLQTGHRDHSRDIVRLLRSLRSVVRALRQDRQEHHDDLACYRELVDARPAVVVDLVTALVRDLFSDPLAQTASGCADARAPAVTRENGDVNTPRVADRAAGA